MICYITTTSFGFIATDNENNIVAYRLFEDNQKQKLEEIRKNKLLDEKKDLILDLHNKYDEVIIETSNSSLYTHLECENLVFEKTTTAGRFIRANLDEILFEITDLKDSDDITSQMNYAFNEVTRDEIQSSIKMNDVMIVETINSLEELDETTGKLIERLHEWCMPYLPELDKIHNQQLYAKLIATETTRSAIKESKLLENSNIDFIDANDDIEVKDSDLMIIKSFAASLCELYDTKNMLEEYIDEKIKEVAPNLYSVAGANISAKLIAHMNGLESLARLPSSTIQIIGAEKATFRHLKTGENPPKHGIIFQHPSIRGSNWWVRGKIARAVASKIAIAARKDAYGNGEVDDNLIKDLDEKVEKIKKDNPFPKRKNSKNTTSSKKSKKDKKQKKQRKKYGKKAKRNKRKLHKGDFNY
ncbi:MAG: ATP-binding protein [Methanosphaera sp.]|uniref:NOP5/NOP56 family protein n=1 Tax=Methanosphaera sp. TaxID=2666342 RepID=UPI0025E0E405|nr:ATP-binding protein [Methanosphaera sp.]MDD6534339.1 ATP-binding protein [Methanosphaera sp.]MDY3955256.1 ATP-binding protein [Methanosphaera sp.]